MMKCDPVTGACLLPELSIYVQQATTLARCGWTVRYVGDPMCSWCWGMSPSVSAVQELCAAEGLEFAITVGGLRAGGGDPWNQQFKKFLRQEWQHIERITGQPFGYSLLDLEHFDYDTEPTCRAIVAFQNLQAEEKFPVGLTFEFFAAVQRKFYVEGEDPKQTSFYQKICTTLKVDFDAFRQLFEAAETQQLVLKEFVKCRQLGVRSFPTLLLEKNGEVTTLVEGFSSPQETLSRLRQVIASADAD
jgi:putative protein-disulfide isomerase